MIIAVASGKGGTGKTTVATSLALSVAGNRKVRFLDCDVEEPNGHILLKPELRMRKKVFVRVPGVVQEKCNTCGRCSEVCAFNAIIPLPGSMVIFPELCHSCGGCWYICPEKAINPTPREIGTVEEGMAGEVEFVHGCLKLGVAISPPLIESVKEYCSKEMLTIVDAPPGTSCPVIKAVEGADFCLLVTEPTPFGIHDLELAVEMSQALKIRCGVVVNRSDGDDAVVDEFCQKAGIPLLLRLPLDLKVAGGYANGRPAIEVRPEWKNAFLKLISDAEKVVQ